MGLLPHGYGWTLQPLGIQLNKSDGWTQVQADLVEALATKAYELGLQDGQEEAEDARLRDL